MKQLAYNRANVVNEMAARATQDLANGPMRVNVITGTTTGYLISDLFDLDVNVAGNRKVSVIVNDVEEMRELIAAARPSAPTNHRRSFTTFLNEMEMVVTNGASRRQRDAEENYLYLLTSGSFQAPTEGQAGYIVRPAYTLRHIGLNDLVSTYNRIAQMQEAGFVWRKGERYGREVVFLSSHLYDAEAQYTDKSFGFSVRVVADLHISDNDIPLITYNMELIADHSSWVNESVRSYLVENGMETTFSVTGNFEAAASMAADTLRLALDKAEYITTFAVEQRVQELENLGFHPEMRLITTEAIAS
jgi:hypothetical protein